MLFVKAVKVWWRKFWGKKINGLISPAPFSHKIHWKYQIIILWNLNIWKIEGRILRKNLVICVQFVINPMNYSSAFLIIAKNMHIIIVFCNSYLLKKDLTGRIIWSWTIRYSGYKLIIHLLGKIWCSLQWMKILRNRGKIWINNWKI